MMVYGQQLGCEIVELNVEPDHVHLLVKVPPKRSISEVIGALKGRTAISTCGSRRGKSHVKNSCNWNRGQADLLGRAARCAPLWGA